MIKVQVFENIDYSKLRLLTKGSDEPIVFKNSGHLRSKASQWNLNYLASHWGDTKLPIQIFPIADNLQPHYESDRDFKHMSLAEYIEHMNTDEKKRGYSAILGKIPLSNFSKIREDISFPTFFKAKPINSVLWLYQQKSTALHYDIVETLLYQVKGRKRILLAKPNTKHMYLFPFFSKTPHFSPVDLENKDLKKYPNLKELEVYEAVIEEGDVLYIPYCWWHQVYGEGETNISIASWYLCHPKKVAQNFMQTMRLWALHLYRFLIRYPV